MITQDQLKDVLERADKLFHYLHIDEKKIEFEEEDLRTQAPDFWEDRLRAEEQVKAIKRWLDGYQEVCTMADELKEAFDFIVIGRNSIKLQYDQWRIDKNWKEISQFLMENEKAKIEAAKQGGCFQTGRAFMRTEIL